MGVVYRGYDTKLDRDVAIKVIETDQGNTNELTRASRDELITRFKTEAKAIAKLTHPNIVNIYDFGADEEKNYMVMEFLKGRDLSQLLKHYSPLSIELVLKCITQVCSALDYAHQNGIIHRDIKPANMTLLDSGIIKLMDFGIARIQDAKSQLTQAGTILGSVLYISPEQLMTPNKVDKRADIYSLGVSTYELVTGKFPYDGDNVASIVSKIMSSEPLAPSLHNPKIPKELDEAILKAISKDIDERFQRAEEFGEVLSDILYTLKTGNSAKHSTQSSKSVTLMATKTSFTKALEFSLVEGLDEINLYSLIYRIVQTWTVENIGNKPLLEAIYSNENLSQAVILSGKVILLVYKGVIIAAVSRDPDFDGQAAYEVTANVTRVDIKSCIPSESQQDFLVILSSILGNGKLIAKHPSCNTNDVDNIIEMAKHEELTGHIEITTKSDIKYKGFIDGNEIFTLVFPNKMEKQNKIDIEIYQAKMKLIGPSLRKTAIDTTLKIMTKSQGSTSSFRQLSNQKLSKILPEFVEEAIRNTNIGVLMQNEKMFNIGKKIIKSTEIVEDFSGYILVDWLIKNLLLQCAKSKNFSSLKSSFDWIWNIETIKFSQSVKMPDGKSVTFSLVAYDINDKMIFVVKYSPEITITSLQNFVDEVSALKKDIVNFDIKSAIFISSEDIYPEVIKFYGKITKKQVFYDLSSPKCFTKGNFNLFLLKETFEGYKLISPEIDF